MAKKGIKDRKIRIILYLVVAIIATIVSFAITGAWFTDKDSVGNTFTLGEAITVRLIGTGEDGELQNFAQLYDSVAGAYPGDKVLDSVKVEISEDGDKSILRVSFYVCLIDSEGNVKIEDLTTDEQTFLTMLQTDLNEKTTLYSSDWTQSDDEWIYYNSLISGQTKPIELFDEYYLPLGTKVDDIIGNEYQNLSFRIYLSAQAIQAANATRIDDWFGDISELENNSLVQEIVKFNAERFADVKEILPYIQFSGEQYIDLDYLPTSDTVVEAEFETSSFGKWLFGSRTNYEAEDTFATYLEANNSIWFQMAGSTPAKQTTSNISGVRSKLKVDKDYVTLNGTKVNSAAFGIDSLDTTTYPMWLGTINNSNVADSRYYVGKIYSFKIWEDGELIRNLYPVIIINDSDEEEVGMFDLVDNKFYSNSGTDEFSYAHSIFYITNGGTNNALNPSTFVSTDLPITLQNPSRTGYIFSGWYLDSKFTGSAQTTLPVGTDSSVYLYAKWIKNYSITYHLGGGVNNADNPAQYNENNLPLTLLNPTRAGYTFAGWFTSSDFSGTACTKIESGTAQNVSLWAKWEANEYSIIYNLNGGTNNPNNLSSFTATSTPVKFYNPTKENYVFSGWYSNSLFTGDKITYIASGTFENVIVYAKWETPYTITYVLDGGLNDGRNPSYVTRDTETITLFNPTKTNYTFDGWYSNSSFSGSAVSTIPTGTTQNLTFYAKWISNIVTVTFDANGGAVTPATKNVISGNTYGDIPTPSWLGHVFTGWKGRNLIDFDDSTKSYTNTYYVDTAFQLVLKQDVSYTLSFDYSIISSTSNSVFCSVGCGTTGFQKDIANTGIFSTSGGRMVLTFTPTSSQLASGNKLAIRFIRTSSPQTVSCLISNVQLEYGNTANPFEEYGNINSSSAVTAIANHTLTATWTSTQYSITYNLDGGTNDSSNPSSYYSENLPITLNNPTKSGYYFAGWYTNSDYTSKQITTIPLNSASNFELWARFSDSPLVFDLVGSNSYSVRAANSSISGSINIPETYNGKPVVSIQSAAFENCSGVTSVTIPNSIKVIGGLAFKNSGITSITIPSSVSAIGISAFENCASLESLTNNSSISAIPNNAFKNCSNIQSFSINASVEEIGASAFEGCDLSNIIIENLVNSIGDRAFFGNNNLATITVYGETPATIGSSVFPSTITAIYVRPTKVSAYKTAWNEYETKIFSMPTKTIAYNLDGGTNNANNLNEFCEIDLPVALYNPSKENYKFSGWYENSSFTGEAVVQITENVNKTLYAKWQRKISITYNLNGGKNNVNNPAYCYQDQLPILLSYPKKENYEFISWTVVVNGVNLGNIKDLTLSLSTMPDLLNGVELTANWKYVSLESLTFTLINSNNEYSVKAKSTNIAGDIVIPSVYNGKPVTVIAENAFKNCLDVTSVDMPLSITQIDGNAFSGCTSLTEIEIPSSCEVLNANAFTGSLITSVHIPASVTDWDYAFYGATALNSVTFDSSITSIPDYAFYNTGFKTIIIPDGITSIGQLAFASCLNLEEVYIPNTVTTISASSYSYAPFLGSTKNVVIYCESSETQTDWGSYWNNKNYSDKYLVVFSATSLPQTYGDWKYVKTSEGNAVLIEYLGNSSAITIPTTINGCPIISIAGNVFKNTNNLEDVFIPSSITNILTSSKYYYSPFYNVNSKCIIYTDASVALSGWNSYWNYYTSENQLSVMYGVSSLATISGDWKYVEFSEEAKIVKYLGNSNKVAIPSSLNSKNVTTLVGNVFEGKTNIEQIYIPSTVTTITTSSNVANSPFYGLDSLCIILANASVQPSNWQNYWNYYSSSQTLVVLYSITGLSTTSGNWEYVVNSSDNAIITKCNDTSSIISIPLTLGGYTTTGMAGIVFKNNTGLQEVFLPSQITHIYTQNYYSNSPFYLTNSNAVIYTNASGSLSYWYSYWNYYDSSTILKVVYSVTGLPQISGDWKYVTKTNSTLGIVKYVGTETSVTIPTEIDSVSVSALVGNVFSGKTSIVEVFIPSSITSISAYYIQYGPFVNSSSECTIYTNATEKLSSWETYWNYYNQNTVLGVVYGVNSFGVILGNWKYIKNTSGEVILLSYLGDESIVTTPTQIDSGNVKKISANTFLNKSCITSLTISAGVTTIDKGSIKGCNNISTLSLPIMSNSLGRIFGAGSDSENSTYVPSSLKTVIVDTTYVPASAFYECSSITSITLTGPTAIYSYTFSGCSSLTSFNIPSSVTSIGSYAFQNCSALESIVVPDSVTSIADAAFQGCNSLVSMTLPFVGYSASSSGSSGVFGYIFGYTRATSNSGYTSSSSAFSLSYTGSYSGAICQWSDRTYSYSVRSGLKLVTRYGTNSYHYYIPTSLRHITITGGTSGVTLKTAAFLRCSMLETITLGNVTSIADYAFYECTGLTKVFIPSNCTTITYSPFSGCSSSCKIYTSATEALTGWNSSWNYYDSVHPLEVYYNRSDINS